MRVDFPFGFCRSGSGLPTGGFEHSEVTEVPLAIRLIHHPVTGCPKFATTKEALPKFVTHFGEDFLVTLIAPHFTDRPLNLHPYCLQSTTATAKGISLG